MAKDQRYLCGFGIFTGFPPGRSPAGDLATAAVKQCVSNAGNASDLKFTRIGKGRERSYWSLSFDEANIRRSISVLEQLGYRAFGNQHRTLSPTEEQSSWTLHVSLDDKAIESADEWKEKKLDLEKLVASA